MLWSSILIFYSRNRIHDPWPWLQLEFETILGLYSVHWGGPKKWKFCDSGQMMEEVIIKWFYFHYFWFHQLYAPAMPQNQNQTKTLCACKDFLMEVFFTIAGSGDEKIKKKIIYFWTLSHSKLLLPSVMEFFTEIAVFLGQPIVQCTVACTKFF